MFAIAVEPLVQVANPFVKFMSLVKKHTTSNHHLLPNTSLQLVPPPASEPGRADNQVLGVRFKVTQNPDIIINPKLCSLLVPSICILWLRQTTSSEIAAPKRKRAGCLGHQGAAPPQQPRHSPHLLILMHQEISHST